jgi:tetratricopeptide (TPR) repeat protein
VSKWRRPRQFLLVPLIACSLCVSGEDIQKQKLDQQYQAAVASFEAGRYAEAAAQLEKLMPYAPKSFEIHELLGMAYGALSQSDKAIEHLKTAVQLKPGSPEARTNLGATLLHSSHPELAGEQFIKALALEPNSYDANHNLGELYVQTGKIAEAQALLERAQQINPNAYDNGFDLAMSDLLLGKLTEARAVVQQLMRQRDTGELHNLLGQIDEREGQFVAAANDYESAAHLDPSEENMFAWGSEMLLHRTYEPAIAIFENAVKRYPRSPRLQIGLGLALYSRGKYDEAVKALIAAADLDPTDPRCYLFLSKAYNSSPLQADDVVERFRRYAEMRPGNALAQYYYAISLWKGKRAGNPGVELSTVESLLRKAIALDDSLAEAHVQLGNLYADQHRYSDSIPQYERALELNPNLSDAHYRLGTDFVHVGNRESAEKEFAVYQKLRAEHLAEVQKERDEVQQFVYSEKNSGTSMP